MNLGIVIKKYRLMMELDLRTLAKEIGIGASTLMRLEHGYDPEYKTFKKVLDWLSKAAGK
jgi:predicted transcriptional regulator